MRPLNTTFLVLGSLSLAIVFAGSSFAASGLSKPLQTPEQEIAQARTELENIASTLRAGGELSKRYGLGPQQFEAEQALAAARRYFAAEEYPSVRIQLNNYLNTAQVPDPNAYIDAQYMLGKSYEAMGMPQWALRAYRRFIASFLTIKDKDYSKFLDVLRHMVSLAASSDVPDEELDKLLATVTSLELPQAIKPHVLFLAAKEAVNTGRHQVASNWLNRTGGAKDPKLRARTLYLNAVLAIARGQLDEAEEILGRIPLVDTGKDPEVRSLSRLAMARLATRQRKWSKAKKYYETVKPAEPLFESALYESIFVHLELNEDSTARAKATQYLTQFRNGAHTQQLRSLLAYLDLRAGDMAQAKTSIENSDLELQKIDRWMLRNFNGNRVNQTQLNDLMTMAGPHVSAPPSIDRASRLFVRLAETSRRLSDIHGEMTDVRYNLARARLADLRPFWVNRTEQLAKTADHLLAVGHRLAAIERNLFANRLSPAETHALKASEARRVGLLSPGAAAKRQLSTWAAFSRILKMTERLAIMERKLTKMRAELASGRALSVVDVPNPDSPTAQRIDRLDGQVTKMRNQIRTALDKVRHKRIKQLVQTGPHQAAFKFVELYREALSEEQAILKPYRVTPKTANQKLFADDLNDLWAHWNRNTKSLTDQIQGLNDNILRGLGQTVDNLELRQAELEQLRAKMDAIRDRLEAALGQDVAFIVGQYRNSMGERLEAHRKWRADLDWLAYNDASARADKKKAAFELEQQILRDLRQDLEQGVLSKWPE